MKPVKKKNNEKVNTKNIKDFIPITIAILVLIVLILVLLVVIFYDDEYGLVLPDAPAETSLTMEIYDFENGKYDPEDLTQKEIKHPKVNYLFVTDYYKEGIILSNTTVDYIDNDFVIYSGPYGTTPYISVVGVDGKLKWINKLNNSYDSLIIKKIEKSDDNYYLFAVGTKNNLNDNMVIKIDSKGNEEKREIFSKASKNAISTAIKIDNGFAVVTEGEEGLMIYTLSYNFKLLKNTYNLINDKNNIFHTYIPYVSALSYKDKIISAVIQYNGLQDETMYLLNYNMDTNSSTITPFRELMKLSNPYTNKIHSYKANFLVGYQDQVYQFNNSGEIINKYDYSKVKLKEDDLLDDNGEKIENYISVEKIKIYEDNILVTNYTNSDYIYDIYDKDLSLKNRYMVNIDEYETKENVLLDVFYIDGKLYEVHSYGFETPSIMISVIG